jgi:hypothetical protein
MAVTSDHYAARLAFQDVSKPIVEYVFEVCHVRVSRASLISAILRAASRVQGCSPPLRALLKGIAALLVI